MSGSLHRWSIVITRFGKPSTSEISSKSKSPYKLKDICVELVCTPSVLVIIFVVYLDWPGLIPDDGLLTANQVLCEECAACVHTSARPHISNVIILSVQPERNIQLFPISGKPTLYNTHQPVLLGCLLLLFYRDPP